MTDPAREALSEAYGLYLTTPVDETFQKKDSLVSSTVLRKRPQRIRYDKDHALILSLPNLNTVTASQTRVSRINTASKCARGFWAGKLIAAAENQPPLLAAWLKYTYDPYCDINPQIKQQIERALFPALFGVWCYWPKRKTPSTQSLNRALILFVWVIRDAVAECRTGLNSLKTSSTFKAEKMGYGKGKAAYQKADYSRAWLPIEQDLKAMLSKIDRLAMDPVMDAYCKLTHTQSTNLVLTQNMSAYG